MQGKNLCFCSAAIEGRCSISLPRAVTVSSWIATLPRLTVEARAATDTTGLRCVGLSCCSLVTLHSYCCYAVGGKPVLYRNISKDSYGDSQRPSSLSIRQQFWLTADESTLVRSRWVGWSTPVPASDFGPVQYAHIGELHCV
jgi:hypothetical protein